MVGHTMATGPNSADSVSWALVSLVALPFLLPPALLAWLGLIFWVAWLRPLETERRFWVIFVWVLGVALALTLARVAADTVMSVRSRCTFGF